MSEALIRRKTTSQAKRFYRAVVVPNLPANPDVAYVTSVVLGTLRNDYSGWLGMQIVVGTNPVTLTAGTTYWVLSQETAGGDRWYDWNTKVTTTGVAADNAVAWGTGPGAWNTDAVAKQSFVPVDFKYTSGAQ